LGSSYLASEIANAYLCAQFEEADSITKQRIDSWNIYSKYFTNFSEIFCYQQIEPEGFSTHNGHIFYLIMKDANTKNRFISEMAKLEIQCASHYVPLHSAPAAHKFSKVGSDMMVTNEMWDRLVRFPIWSEEGLPIDRVLETSVKVLKSLI